MTKLYKLLLAAALFALAAVSWAGPLSPAQIATLRAAVAAEPSLATAVATSNDLLIRAWVNAPSGQFAYRSTTPADEINNAILWSRMTPADVPDLTQIYANRALYTQAKQISLQTLLQGRSSVATGYSNIRLGLEDALTKLPTAVGGTDQAAGWSAVKTVITRPATRAEALLAVTDAQHDGTLAKPFDFAFEGLVTPDEVSYLR